MSFFNVQELNSANCPETDGFTVHYYGEAVKIMKTPNKKEEIMDVQPLRDYDQITDMKWALKRFCGERDYILFWWVSTPV